MTETIKLKGDIKMECKICSHNKELRMEVCFDCAEAEAIISEGLDMYDKGRNETNDPEKTVIGKLQFLIEKGWSNVNKA